MLCAPNYKVAGSSPAGATTFNGVGELSFCDMTKRGYVISHVKPGRALSRLVAHTEWPERYGVRKRKSSGQAGTKLLSFLNTQPPRSRRIRQK